MADHSSYAKERKKKLETVRIKATIPPALASTIDMAKLKSEKTAVLTLQVRSIGLQEGNDEIAYPVSIGSLAGEAIAIAKTVLKK
ncbi:MAG: hypothetical protein IID33_14115 [Planctomycetes bacterium]|nr:hypothetical protein [Planctomycetota bacterium]